jgi:lysophospholipase L1-like esterase
VIAGAQRRRELVANLALAAVSLGAFLVVAELAARSLDLRARSASALANPPWLGERWFLTPEYRDRLARIGVLARYYDLYRWDRFLFYRLRSDVELELLDPLAPEAAVERTRWSVRTNARGWRGPPFADRPAAGTVRVAALGDSSTFGWGVEHSETWVERVREALAGRWQVPAARIETLNLGVPGYSSFQGRVLLERTAIPLAPDLVVWSYLSNDGAPTGADDAASYEKRVGWTGALLAFLHRSRAFETFESWAALARARLRPAAAPDPRDPAQRNVPNLRASRANVRAAVAAARGAGIPIVLLAQCISDPWSRTMREVALETGTPFLDAPELLHGAIRAIEHDPRWQDARERIDARYGAGATRRRPRWLAFLPDGCHPNPIGHELVAEALADLVVGAWPELRP